VSYLDGCQYKVILNERKYKLYRFQVHTVLEVQPVDVHIVVEVQVVRALKAFKLVRCR
jgi:hypothetical protein